MVKRPCLDCGRPAQNSRCTDCGIAFDRRRALQNDRGGRPHYRGDYGRRARAVRATATVCWICGDGPRQHDPWQADHVLPAAQYGGEGPLAPAHRSCNVARANRLRAAQPHDPALARLTARRGGRPPTDSAP